MTRRLSRIGLGIFAVGVVSAMLLGLYGAWRLSQGPVSLGVLKPYLEERLAGSGLPHRVAFSDLVLAWGGTERPLELVISDAELRGEDERVVARISEISMGLSLPALLEGTLVLKTVRLTDAHVTAVRRKDGTISIGLAGEGGQSLTLFESGNGGGSEEVPPGQARSNRHSSRLDLARRSFARAANEPGAGVDRPGTQRARGYRCVRYRFLVGRPEAIPGRHRGVSAG